MAKRQRTIKRKKPSTSKPTRRPRPAKRTSKRSKKSAAPARQPARLRKRATPKRKAPQTSVRPKPPAAAPAAPPGAFAWHELATTQTERCRKFYWRLFRWSAESFEMMPEFTYTKFHRDGLELGGMLSMTPEWGEVAPRWLVYVCVDDVDVASARAEELGGEVSVPPHEIPLGRLAVIRDPTGAAFGLLKRSI